MLLCFNTVKDDSSLTSQPTASISGWVALLQAVIQEPMFFLSVALLSSACGFESTPFS